MKGLKNQDRCILSPKCIGKLGSITWCIAVSRWRPAWTEYLIICFVANGTSHRLSEQAIFTLANNIRKYRIERALTIEELANLIGVDYSQIGRVERGVDPNVSIILI